MELSKAFQVNIAEKSDKQTVDELLRHANEADQKILDRSIINYDNLLPIDVLRTRYRAVTVDRVIEKRWVKKRRNGLKILDYQNASARPSSKFLSRIKKIQAEKISVINRDYASIERLFPFDFENIHSHDWFLLLDGIGVDTCFHCNGEKYVTCDECNGRHEWRCRTCNGSGDVRCRSCHGSGEDTDFDGETTSCGSCHGDGEVRCGSCDGDGDITCRECYGDNRDNRYGKVDCPTCDAVGQLVYFHYIRTMTETLERNVLLTHRFGKNIPLSDRLNQRLRDTYISMETGESILTFQRDNTHIHEAYHDHYMKFISQFYCDVKSYAKENAYPLLLEEEMSYKQMPFYKIDYAFMADIAQPYQLLLRNYIDQTQIIFDTTLQDKKYNAQGSFSTWLHQDWGSQSQLQLDDEFRSIVFMAYMAKSDGFICYDEKKYIASRLSPIYEQLSKRSQRYINEMIGYEKPSEVSKQYAKLSSKAAIPVVFEKVDAFLKANNMTMEGEIQSRYDDLYSLVDWHTPKYYASVLHTIIWVVLTLGLLAVVFYLVTSGII